MKDGGYKEEKKGFIEDLYGESSTRRIFSKVYLGYLRKTLLIGLRKTGFVPEPELTPGRVTTWLWSKVNSMLVLTNSAPKTFSRIGCTFFSFMHVQMARSK